MKIITFGSAAIMAFIITWTVAARPSIAEIEACCNTEAEQTKIEHYVKSEPSGEAAAALARRYALAAGGPSDEAKAMFWFRHAAEKEFPAAIAHVGAHTAKLAIQPCFDAEAAAEARELLGNPLLQTPQWNEFVSKWLTTMQTSRVSTAACHSPSAVTIQANVLPHHQAAPSK